MSYELGHKKYTIQITFVAAAGMNSKVLDEVKELRLFVEGNVLSGRNSCFDHASDVRFTITHEEITNA